MKVYLHIALIVCAVMLNFTSWAQQYNWTYHQNAGNPGGLNTESDAPGQASWIDILDGPISANTWSSTVAIPFSFDFYGTPVTHLKASANGLVTFDTLSTQLTDNNFALPSDSIPNMTIACFWDEFTTSPPTLTGDDIRYKVFGTAPNRQLWIKWYSFEMGDPFIFTYMAVVLEESTNNIYIVDQYTSSTIDATQNLLATVGLQLDNSTATQAGGGFVNYEGNGTSNADNDYYSFEPLDSFDIALTQVTNPSGAACPGTTNIQIEVLNLGETLIDSVDISFTINGSPATTIGFGNLNLNSLEAETLSLGNFTFLPATNYDFVIYISGVNATLDTVNENDTLSILGVQTGMNGTYTIDAGSATAGTNFNSFADAAFALNNYGVCGPVIINVDSGLYQDSVYLGEIIGVSAVNTVTIDGGSAADVKLTYDGGSVEPTWQMAGVDYFTVKNITIENTKATADAWGVHLSNASDYNTFDSCRFIVPIGTTSDVQCLVTSSSLTVETGAGNNANYLTITNSYFRGGETGIHLEGIGAGNPTFGYWIENNTFRNHSAEAIETGEIQQIDIIGNDVDSITNSGGDGLYLLDIRDYRIEGNRVNVVDYGLYVLDGNDAFTPATRSRVVNNMIISTSDYGIYLNDFESTVVYHNTVIGSPAMLINDQSNVNIRNNIFIGQGDFAFESTDALTANDTIDYNIYDSDFTNMFDIGVNVYSDLAAWQLAESAYNANSIEGTPLFASATDLHVSDALANDVGDNTVGVLTDIDGDARPATTIVDIGADEYTPLADDVSTIAILSPTNSLCESDAQFVEVIVSNFGYNNQDTIPFLIEAVGNATETIFDTIYPVLGSFSTDTFTFGPINTIGLGMSTLKVISLLANDENNGNDTVIINVMFDTLNAPVTAIDDIICGPGDTATLAVSSTAGLVQWYATENSSAVIHVGDTFVSPTTGAVSYWVTQRDFESHLVGAADNTIGTFGNFASITAQALLFDALSEFTLDSVTVYPNGSGNVVIELQDLSSTVLQTTTVSVNPANALDPVRIPVGFQITPGSYRLAAGAATTTGGLGRNSSGANYPYSVAGMVDITNSTFGSSSYYFYYNWRISTGTCESERIEVRGIIDSTVVELPADQQVCINPGKVIDPLEIGFTYTSYLWHDSSTDSTFLATEAGTVAVTVTSIYGCERSDNMNITTYPEPQVFIGNDTSFCDGEDFSVTWDAGPGFDVYFWSNAGQTQAITVNYPGNFFVTVYDANNCIGLDTAVISINPLPIADAGTDTIICEDSTFALPIIGGGLTGIWINPSGDTITVAGEAGQYVLEVTDINGCSGLDTMVVSHEVCEDSTDGIAAVGGNQFRIYPNPTNGVLHIEFETANDELTFELFDALGNLVYSETAVNRTHTSLELGQLAKGYYMLRMRSNDDQAISRVILQ